MTRRTPAQRRAARGLRIGFLAGRYVKHVRKIAAGFEDRDDAGAGGQPERIGTAEAFERGGVTAAVDRARWR